VVRKQSGERGIWQRRFWEHTIKDERDYRHHIDYVHVNPFKHGLVERVVDWPFSSFHRAVKQGIYDPWWCGEKHDSLTLKTQDDIDYGERT
jgi:putative transposase